MMQEKYNLYKTLYNDYCVLIRSGNFYVCINDDALILNSIMNYKINETSNFIKVGFPITSKIKVTKYLENKNINYLVVDKQIIDKYKCKDNKYKEYLIKYKNYNNILSRINKVSTILKNNILHDNINNVIGEIEKIIDKYKLKLNDKTKIYNIKNGFEFLGFRYYIKNNKIVMKVKTSTKKNFKRKMKNIIKLLEENRISEKSFLQVKNSYIGHLSYGNCKSLIKNII